MFKRVVKRQKKREQEEENGITEEVKEMMGWQRSDSSSSSDSDSDNASVEVENNEVSSSDSEDERPSRKRKRPDTDDEDEGGQGRGSSALEDEDEEEGIEVNEAEMSRLTVKKALKNPIDEQSCVICPGKVLKNLHMEQTHLASASHKRRVKRFTELSATLATKLDNVYSDSASLVVQLMQQESSGPNKKVTANPSEISNRAKRKKHTERMKEKRKKKKMAVAAKSSVPSAEPAKPEPERRKKKKKLGTEE